MRKVCAVCVFLAGSVLTGLSQGSLTPPGAPGATMRTLDEIDASITGVANALEQVESRIDLATVAGNATYEHVISQPGSYYLSGNLDVATANGISIDSEGVTLDLNGFQISRSTGEGGWAIYVGTHPGVRILNGDIQGFADGVHSFGSGIVFQSVSISGCSGWGLYCLNSASVLDCAARNNSGGGIRTARGSILLRCKGEHNSGLASVWAGAGSVLNECVSSYDTATNGIVAGAGSSLAGCCVYNNQGGGGLSAGRSSTLENCAVYNCAGDYGIYADDGSLVRGCTSGSNYGSGEASCGIEVGADCMVRDCSVKGNITTADSPTSAQGGGIVATYRSTVIGCLVDSNQGDGIRVISDCVVRENTADRNGLSGDGAGIHATSSDNRIEGNSLTDNDRGIDVDSMGNFIVRNTASGNSTNWDVYMGNVCYVLEADASVSISGDSGGVSPGSTDPNANYTY